MIILTTLCFVIVTDMKILVTGGAGWEFSILDTLPSEILFVFKRHQKIISLYSKPAPPFPGLGNYYGTFAGKSDGQLLVGQNRLMFLYNPQKNVWFQLPWQNSCMRNYASSCAINERTLVIAGHAYDSDNRVQLFQAKQSPPNPKAKPAFSSCFSSTNEPMLPGDSHWFTCQTRLPVNVQGHSIVNVSENRVMLVGVWVKDALV